MAPVELLRQAVLLDGGLPRGLLVAHVVLKRHLRQARGGAEGQSLQRGTGVGYHCVAQAQQRPVPRMSRTWQDPGRVLGCLLKHTLKIATAILGRHLLRLAHRHVEVPRDDRPDLHKPTHAFQMRTICQLLPTFMLRCELAGSHCRPGQCMNDEERLQHRMLAASPITTIAAAVIPRR